MSINFALYEHSTSFWFNFFRPWSHNFCNQYWHSKMIIFSSLLTSFDVSKKIWEHQSLKKFVLKLKAKYRSLPSLKLSKLLIQLVDFFKIRHIFIVSKNGLTYSIIQYDSFVMIIVRVTYVIMNMNGLFLESWMISTPFNEKGS